MDFFPPVIDDPRIYGAIAAANAMSDVYAMGGEVLLALNVVGFPEDLEPGILGNILAGGAEKVREAGGVIAGGHTLYDPEPKYGLAVTGLVHPDRVVSKAGARPGDALVLTKALGTGILLTSVRDGADARTAEPAVQSMLALNRHAMHVALETGAHAMTDVTGFGLLGHASEIALRSNVRVVIEAARVPALPRALELAASGVTTGGEARNREGLRDRVVVQDDVEPARVRLLYDPQTSGGLLFALDAAHAEAVAERLRGDGLAAAVIGRVEEGAGVIAR